MFSSEMEKVHLLLFSSSLKQAFCPCLVILIASLLGPFHNFIANFLVWLSIFQYPMTLVCRMYLKVKLPSFLSLFFPSLNKRHILWSNQLEIFEYETYLTDTNIKDVMEIFTDSITAA